MTETLFTITGWPARILKLVVGVPFLLAGGLFVLGGLFGGFGTVTTAATLVVGTVIGLVGVLSWVSAVQSDEVAIGKGTGGGGGP